MLEKLKNYLRPHTPSGIKTLYRRFKKRSVSEIEHDRKIISLKENFVQLNKHAGKNQLVFREGICFNVHPDSRFGFEHFCHISTEMVEEMDSFIAKTVHKKALLDIGALHGIFSLVFAINDPAKKVIAVDASPLAFTRLLFNIETNNLKNITPVNCALSDTGGVLSMHYEWEHAVAVGTVASNQEHLEIIKRTGDELCDTLAFEPDVIKIDVEGHEIKVLKGLIKTIERCRPLVFLELHPSMIKQEKDDVGDLLQIFRTYNYKAFLPGDVFIADEEIRGLKNVTRIVLDPGGN